MPLDTTKSVKSITYNGTNIPLYAKPEQTKTVDLSMASGNQVVSPDSGKVLSSVTVNKPSTLIPDNIKKDVNIGGVVGSGDTSETWVLNEVITGDIDETLIASWTIPTFISNGVSYTGFAIQSSGLLKFSFNYTNSNISTQAMNLEVGGVGYTFVSWSDKIYRKLIFSTAPAGALLTWLQANGVKQEKNLAIQPSKSLTITSNGTTTITPDVPYDAMGQVGVTVNVASGGGEITQLQVRTATDNTPCVLFCLWQTSNGWTVTSNFDTTTDFTIPNVTVGGYVIFTREPEAASSFSITPPIIGVQRIDVDVMDTEMDTLGAALVMKVTASSPEFTLILHN